MQKLDIYRTYSLLIATLLITIVLSISIGSVIIYPKDIFERYKTSTCITTWTKSGYPIIDEIKKNLFVSVGGNGSAAKSSDYIGKISSDLILDNEWDKSVDKNSNKIHEAADVIYHLMVYLEANDIKIEDVMSELKKRKK